MSKKALIIVDVQNDFCPGGTRAPLIVPTLHQIKGHRDVVEEEDLVRQAVVAAFDAGAVVGGEDDQRIVQLVEFLEYADQLADVVIDERHIRGKHFHLMGEQFTLLIVEVAPSGNGRIARREFGPGRASAAFASRH